METQLDEPSSSTTQRMEPKKQPEQQVAEFIDQRGAKVQIASTTSAHKPSATANRASAHVSSSPFRQSLLPWTLALLTIASYSITVCYALGTTRLRYLPFANLSPTRSLAIVRAMSELTSLCTILLIKSCTERVLWMFVSRARGTPLATFLALYWGSGMWAWTQLILRNAKGGRIWSWLRIMLTITIPVLAVILLSAIDVQTFFDAQTTFPVAAGVGNFDPSLAPEYNLVAATYMATDFSSLLQSSKIAWPMPVLQSNSTRCSTSNVFSGDACGNGFFLHGGLDLATPSPAKNKAITSASVYTINSLRGVQLDFTNVQPGARIDGTKDCIVLGDDNLAFQICVSQSAKNEVTTKYVHCPSNLRGSCITNKSWQSSTGWTSTMTAYARHATVHFSRVNYTAVSITDFSQPIPYAVSAADILSVFQTTLNATTGLGRPLDSAQQFVWYIANYLTFAETSSTSAAQALSRLYNLMAMPVYYFQPTYLSPSAGKPYFDTFNPDLPTDQGLYTTASLSTSYYGLKIASWTILVYAIVMGIVICLCLVVLALGSVAKTAGRTPDTTAWPFIDVAAECQLVDGAHSGSSAFKEETYQNRGIDNSLHDLVWRVKGASGFAEKAKVMTDMKVKLLGNRA